MDGGWMDSAGPTGACAGSNFLMMRITSDGKRHITCGKWKFVALEEDILHVGRDVPNC